MNTSIITINGDKVILKFGYPQTKEFAVALAANTALYFEGENITAFGIAKLLQTAYNNFCIVSEEKPKFSLEVFSDWVDESDKSEQATNEILEAVKVWQESKYTKLWLDEIKKKTAEFQKPQPTKSKGSTKKLKQPSTQTESGNGS